MRYKFYVSVTIFPLNGWSWDNILLSQEDIDKDIFENPTVPINIEYEQDSSSPVPGIIVKRSFDLPRRGSDVMLRLGINRVPMRGYTFIIVDETHRLFNLDIILKMGRSIVDNDLIRKPIVYIKDKTIVTTN